MLTNLKHKKCSTQVHIRCTHEQLTQLQENADTYAGGNLSAWLKYAGEHFVPKASELSKPQIKTKKK
jgi:hypothetical protein